jgi:hypothetical protein
VQPGDGALHHPAVTPHAFRGLDACAGQARQDAPMAQGGAVGRRVVGFVSVQFVRSTEGYATSKITSAESEQGRHAHEPPVSSQHERETVKQQQ